MSLERHVVAGAFDVLSCEGNTDTPQEPGVEARPGSESMAKAQGVCRELGRTEGVLGTKHRKQRVTPVNNTLAAAGRFPLLASERGDQPEVERGNARNEAVPEKPGSRSHLIVPTESRRTSPVGAWE